MPTAVPLLPLTYRHPNLNGSVVSKRYEKNQIQTCLGILYVIGDAGSCGTEEKYHGLQVL